MTAIRPARRTRSLNPHVMVAPARTQRSKRVPLRISNLKETLAAGRACRQRGLDYLRLRRSAMFVHVIDTENDSDPTTSAGICRGDPNARDAPAKSLVETLPIDERIQRRAYDLYILRGNDSGSELEDWFQAEEEIRRAQEGAIDES